MQKYTESVKRTKMKYTRDKTKRVQLNYKKSYYEEELEPLIKKAGYKHVSKFIKDAVEEKLVRDGLKNSVS